jgi:hypothetical protein
VLFLSSETATQAVSAAPDRALVVIAFVSGAGIQVILALFYKSVLAYLYFGESDNSFKSTKRYRFSKYMYTQHLPELFADIATVILFAWGTFRAFTVILETAASTVGA